MGSRTRAALLAIVAAALAAVAPATAWAASGGPKPSEAPLIEVGQHYFGNTNNTTREHPAELWKLPSLLTGDAITIGWHAHYFEVGSPRLCLIQNVDDFNWIENRCNASQEYSVPAQGDGSVRSVIEVRAATSGAFVEFQGCGSGCEFGTYNGAYDFVVESIQHAVAVSLAPMAEIQPTSTLTGSANLSSGAPVPDGLVFTLSASWVTPKNKASHQQTYTVTSSGGGLSFPLNLPKNTEGNKVSFSISRPADSQYLEAKSASVEIPVVLPPEGIAVASPSAQVKHGTARVGLSCQGGGPCKGNLRLIARFRLGGRSHKATIGRIGFSLAAEQKAAVPVKLSRRGRSLLRRARRHRLPVHLVGRGVRSRNVVLREAAQRH